MFPDVLFLRWMVLFLSFTVNAGSGLQGSKVVMVGNLRDTAMTKTETSLSMYRPRHWGPQGGTQQSPWARPLKEGEFCAFSTILTHFQNCHRPLYQLFSCCYGKAPEAVHFIKKTRLFHLHFSNVRRMRCVTTGYMTTWQGLMKRRLYIISRGEGKEARHTKARLALP